VDVGGWFIGDALSPTADELPEGTMIPSGGFLLITPATTTASFWNIPLGTEVIMLESSIGSNGLANTGDAVFLSNTEEEIDAMSYGTNTDVFTPSVPDSAEGHSLKRNNLTNDTDTGADWEDNETPTPGE